MFRELRGLLIDLDGTVYCKNKAICGAATALSRVKEKGWAYRFVTNTTTARRSSIQKKLEALGIAATESEIFSGPFAAARWLRRFPNSKSWILTRGDAIEEFRDLEQSSEQPDFVVMGDLMHGFTFELLNQVFRKLLNGAELIALQKNRYWIAAKEILLDAGAFVAALEYATGRAARVIGKPSLDFFELAVADLGLSAHEVAMVGDDFEADILGGHAAGLKTVLVKTGKFLAQSQSFSLGIRPDLLLESIADLSVHVS